MSSLIPTARPDGWKLIAGRLSSRPAPRRNVAAAIIVRPTATLHAEQAGLTNRGTDSSAPLSRLTSVPYCWFNVTGTVIGVPPPAGVIVIVPEKGAVPVPTFWGFADTVMLAGAVPDEGVTESQPVLCAVMVKLAELVELAAFETTNCCVAG